MKSEEWDNKDRKRLERDEHFERPGVSKDLQPLVEKYAKVNNIDLFDNDDEPIDYYDFLNDARFIDFAYDQSRIIFNERMFKGDDEITDEDIKKFGFI